MWIRVSGQSPMGSRKEDTNKSEIRYQTLAI